MQPNLCSLTMLTWSWTFQPLELWANIFVFYKLFRLWYGLRTWAGSGFGIRAYHRKPENPKCQIVLTVHLMSLLMPEGWGQLPPHTAILPALVSCSHLKASAMCFSGTRWKSEIQMILLFEQFSFFCLQFSIPGYALGFAFHNQKGCWSIFLNHSHKTLLS